MPVVGGFSEGTMDPAKIEAWYRLRDQVLQNPNWPRALWFTALEDGLRAAFGEESQLLADFRRDRAELLRLEQRASGSYHDGRRIEQLEAQISQLVSLADRMLLADGSDPDEARSAAARPVAKGAAASAVASAMASAAGAGAPPRRTGWRAPGARLAAGLLLLALGIAGASVYYEMRLRSEADQQLVRIDRLLDQRLASLRADLEWPRQASGDGVGEAAGALGGRTEALGEALDDLGLDVAALELRLPPLRQQLERLTAGAGQMADDLAGAGAEIAALEVVAPELTAWLAREKAELERDVQSQRDALGGITAGVQDLDDEIDRSRALLTSFTRSLDQGLDQARRDGEALQNAVEAVRASGLEVAKLIDGAETKVQAAIDQMLSELAEQADLAVLRGEDAITRAESELDRRIEQVSEATLDALAQERAAQLAALAEQVAATQLELEQTRAGVVASWQRMDQSVAERHSEALAGLDAYASSMEARVGELLEALDVMVARTGG